MINNKGKYATITIRATDQEKEQLQELADNERRTLGGFVYLVLMDYLKENKQ